MEGNRMVQKNQEFEVTIDALGTDGEGIGRIDGYALFVKDALVGDVVRVKVMKTKKTYGYARLLEIITPSKDRIEAPCPIARQCGGCQIQHFAYKKQLEYKEEKVKGCLERIGKFHVVMASDHTEKFTSGQLVDGKECILMDDILGMESPFYYRNKAQFPVGLNKKGEIVTGFYASRSHSIIETDRCYIQAIENEELLEMVRSFLSEYNISSYNEETHSGLVRHVLTRVGKKTGEIMVCIIINGKKLPHSQVLVERLKEIPGMTSICLNVNEEKTNVILGKEVLSLWGPTYITDYIGDVKFRISPLSFYQVNPVQTEQLYQQALDYADLKGTEKVWDLYCGIGTISLFLAKNCKEVYGVEIVPQAIEDAKINAEINGITNANFFVGAAEDVLPAKYKEDGVHAEVIVVDPPRKGCAQSLLDTIIEMAPQRVVYVSCDPATLARDLRYLADRGYVVERARAVDMFPNTTHVETVCLLSKLHEAKHHVNVKLDMDEMDLTAAESKATYEEIKAYVAEHNDGMKVSNLYIAQVKAKYGIIERENYNKPKSDDARQPKCPKEKENAIVEALRYFRMI